MGIEKDQLWINADQLINLLLCAICRAVLERPKELPCGHRYCEDCIFTWGRERRQPNKTCPTCRQVYQETQVGPVSDNTIMDVMGTLAWTCDHVGCGSSMPVAERDDHSLACAFRVVPCPRPHCPQRIRRQDIRSHMRRAHLIFRWKPEDNTGGKC